MEKLRVLLVCGSGASSGFMAANIRKSAKVQGLDWQVNARSDSEIANYIEDTDLIMVGPHLECILDEVSEWTDEYPNVKVILMKAEYYARLDGDLAVNHIKEVYGI